MLIEDKDETLKSVKKKEEKSKEKREVTFDIPFEDVLKWQKEGYDLIFSWENPIKLESEQFKLLSVKNKDRYYQAIEASKGEDLVGTSRSAQKPYKNEYSVKPGSPTEKMNVINKEEHMEYRWTLPSRVASREAMGWVVDHGQARKQINNIDGDVKVIGTRDKAELVLMKIDKRIVEERERKNREKYQKYKEHALESFERVAINAGSKVLN